MGERIEYLFRTKLWQSGSGNFDKHFISSRHSHETESHVIFAPSEKRQ